MNRDTAARLREFIRNDPSGFTSALINTIDTHAELPAEVTIPVLDINDVEAVARYIYEDFYLTA